MENSSKIAGENSMQIADENSREKPGEISSEKAGGKPKTDQNRQIFPLKVEQSEHKVFCCNLETVFILFLLQFLFLS